jgi:hypothetical protein
MQIIKGTYKKSETDKREIELYKMFSDEKHYLGIDLTKLEENEKNKFIELTIQYENDIKDFVKKSFRNFFIEKIENLSITEIKKEKESGE